MYLHGNAFAISINNLVRLSSETDWSITTSLKIIKARKPARGRASNLEHSLLKEWGEILGTKKQNTNSAEAFGILDLRSVIPRTAGLENRMGLER